MLEKIQQCLLRDLYDTSKPLYIVAYWYDYGVIEARWNGKIDKNGNPLTIHYEDGNGTEPYYEIVPWYLETSGTCIAYFFNPEQASALARRLRKRDGI